MYIVMMFTAGKQSQPVTIPLPKREAMKIAGQFNGYHEEANIPLTVQHFFIEREN